MLTPIFYPLAAIQRHELVRALLGFLLFTVV